MTTFWVYKDTTGQWRWRLLAGNNKIIADSGESYHNKLDCLNAISLVKASAQSTVKES